MNSSKGKTPCVAIIDVGSNSIKLLVAGLNTDGSIATLSYAAEETRIGEGITGSPPRISDTAIALAAEAIARLANRAKTFDPIAIKAVATSAAREASNQDQLREAVQKNAGLELSILSGKEEADLIGQGIQCDPRMSLIPDYTLIDLGGGSLELVQFTANESVFSHSFPLGCVRIASQFVNDRTLPLDPEIERKIATHTRNLVSEFIPQQAGTSTATTVLTGGTATIASKLIGSYTIDRSTLEAFHRKVCSADLSTRIQLLNIPEPRADVFPTATTILSSALDLLGSSHILTSRYNLRYGLAKQLLSDN